MCTTVAGGVTLVDSTGLPYCWEMCFAWAHWAMVQWLSVQVTTLDEVRTLIFGEAWHGMMLRMTMNEDYVDWGRYYLWSIVSNRPLVSPSKTPTFLAGLGYDGVCLLLVNDPFYSSFASGKTGCLACFRVYAISAVSLLRVKSSHFN